MLQRVWGMVCDTLHEPERWVRRGTANDSGVPMSDSIRAAPVFCLLKATDMLLHSALIMDKKTGTQKRIYLRPGQGSGTLHSQNSHHLGQLTLGHQREGPRTQVKRGMATAICQPLIFPASLSRHHGGATAFRNKFIFLIPSTFGASSSTAGLPSTHHGASFVSFPLHLSSCKVPAPLLQGRKQARHWGWDGE